MSGLSTSQSCDSARLCARCSVPLDAKIFDESSFSDPPDLNRSITLAHFELPPQYCGVLEFFSQFTDAQARDHSRIRTFGLVWTLRINHRPFYPYLQMDHIVNPWGFGSFQVSLRLEERANVDLIIRGVSDVQPRDPDLNKVAGRIFGRYWYNPEYGDVERHRA